MSKLHSSEGEAPLPNIFRLVKLARTAYKAAPVVIPIGLAVAKYAKSKLEKHASRRAGSSPLRRDLDAAVQAFRRNSPPSS